MYTRRRGPHGICAFLGITWLGIAALTFLEGIINMWHQHGVERFAAGGRKGAQFILNLVCIQLVFVYTFCASPWPANARVCPPLPIPKICQCSHANVVLLDIADVICDESMDL